ncbi:hypothetical protein V8G54_034415 [Vigna mungo]|uniref:Uncharacterized protein n=1 Tax=Vigna mungo TaxID=3915 RepID=A0AAQ3MQ71_VIGMU
MCTIFTEAEEEQAKKSEKKRYGFPPNWAAAIRFLTHMMKLFLIICGVGKSIYLPIVSQNHRESVRYVASLPFTFLHFLKTKRFFAYNISLLKVKLLDIKEAVDKLK